MSAASDLIRETAQLIRSEASLRMQRDEAVRMLREYVDFMQSADVSFGDDEDEAEAALGKVVDFLARVEGKS